MRNKIVTLTILSIIVIATALSGCVTRQKEITSPEGGKVSIEGGGAVSSWCQAGMKITSSGPSGQQGSFVVKGMTKHNGKDVCEAEYTYDQGSMTQYFNEKNDYIVMVYKDKSGKVIQEINMNDSGGNP